MKNNIKKEKFVENLFSSIAPRYDLANSLMTFGLVEFWRKKLVRISCVSKNAKVLDCAAGTGKLALCFLKSLGEKGEVTGVDFCSRMLNQIKIKDPRMQFKKADVMDLPFPAHSFDIVSIAYGLRNLSDMEQGLKEMARVLKPQGLLMVLETGEASNPWLKPFFHFYFKKIVPFIGGWATGRKEAYQYLNESSLSFPSGKNLIEILKKTNCFDDAVCFPLMGGASFIYKARSKKVI